MSIPFQLFFLKFLYYFLSFSCFCLIYSFLSAFLLNRLGFTTIDGCWANYFVINIKFDFLIYLILPNIEVVYIICFLYFISKCWVHLLFRFFTTPRHSIAVTSSSSWFSYFIGLSACSLCCLCALFRFFYVHFHCKCLFFLQSIG